MLHGPSSSMTTASGPRMRSARSAALPGCSPATSLLMFPSAPGSALKEILIRSLGILAVVEKRREIYFIDNVKFHLDTVKGLGSFVEIEAIDVGGTIGKEALLAQCQSFLELFRIARDDLVAISYSDLILAAGGHNSLQRPAQGVE